MSARQIEILLLSGSAGFPSHVRTTLETLADLLHERDASASLWDLADDPLPLFQPPTAHASYATRSDPASRLARLAESADAFVWASPVYHNSFSGILKNALDSLTIQQFRHKPVALISSGNSERTAVQPCDHLRIVARGLHAVAIPAQVVTITSDFERVHGHYTLLNACVRERLASLADELLSYATMLRQMREQQLSVLSGL